MKALSVLLLLLIGVATSGIAAESETKIEPPKDIIRPAPSATDDRSQPDEKQQILEAAKGEASPPPSPTNQTASTKIADQKVETRNWFDWYAGFGPSTWADWSVALLAIAAAGVGFFTLRSINRQVTLAADQLRVAEVAANAADRSAHAAEKAAQLAEASLKSDRPYLLVQEANVTGARSIENPNYELAGYKDFFPRAYITFKNYGKGPALIETAVIRLFPLTELPAVNDFTDCRDADVENTACAAIGAGDPWKIATDIIDSLISEDTHADIRNGAQKITVWGQIRYKDVFGTNYNTAFCWVLDVQELYIAKSVNPVQSIRFISGPKTHNWAT